jgi:hypothetical protein
LHDNVANHVDVIFIERDPFTFEYIDTFLKTGTTNHIPLSDHWRKRIHKDSVYYNITSLIEFFDPKRYPIEVSCVSPYYLTFKKLGETNIQMKKEEDAIRTLFAQDRENPILNDPYLGLLPIFDVLDTFRQEDAVSILFSLLLTTDRVIFLNSSISSINHRNRGTVKINHAAIIPPGNIL